MSISFTDNKLFQKELEKQLALINNSYVLVGFQENSQTKQETKNGRTKKGGKSMAQIAADNEFGVPSRRVPPRPFMSTSFDENKANINKAIDNQYKKIIDGQTTVQKALGLIGLYMIDLIQKKILEIRTPANSTRTILAKKSDKPLIDFGQMLAAVASKVVLK